MTLSEPVTWDPFQPVNNCRNAAQHVDFVLIFQRERAHIRLRPTDWFDKREGQILN